MGNNNSTNYENDPYLNPNNRDRNLLNSIYANNRSVVPLHNSEQNANVRMLAEQQIKKKTKAYKNPIRLDRNTIKFEKDGMKPGVYYIEFTYSSEKPLLANFYFNAEVNHDPKSNTNFLPSEKFQNSIIKGNLEAGTNITFCNANVYFDMPFYSQNRIYDNKHYDLIIELMALTEVNTVECIFCTFCEVIPDQGGASYKIKPELQKLKVANSWFDIQDIYGFTSDNNECEICCNARKNTIFLPCKHSYACKDCAIMIRIKGHKCPICRHDISDSVVIENIDTLENKTNNVTSELSENSK